MRFDWRLTIAASVWPLTPLPAQPPVSPPRPTAAGAADRAASIDTARRRLDAVIATKGAAGAEAADATETLATALYQGAHKAEAVPLMRRVVAIRERTGPPEALALALNRLGIVIDDPRETEALGRRAIAIATPIASNRALLAMAYANLGDGLHDQRRFAEADLAYRQALEITRAAVGDASPSTASRYLQIAKNLDDMGKFADAEAIYRQALPVLAAGDGRDHPDVALANDMLAQNLLRQDRFADAEPYAREALRVREQAFGPDAQPTFNAQETLANILVRQRKLPEAEALARRLIERRTEACGAVFVDLVADRGRMGQILAMEGRKPESIAAFREAVALARAKLDEGDPLLAHGLMSLGGAIVQANPGDPEALALARQAVALTQSERARALSRRGGSRAQQALARALGGDPATGDLARRAGENFMLVSELRILQFPAERDAMRIESFGIAQDLAQSAAGRAMAQTTAREAAGTGPLATLVRRQQDLTAQAKRQSEALVAALGSGVETEARLRAENVRLGTELARVDAELRRTFPDYARMIAPQPLGERDAQARLRTNEGLLLVTEVGDTIFLYGVSKHAAVRATAPIEGPAARAMLARLRCNVDPLTCPTGVGEATAAYAHADALALYRALVAPVEQALGGVKTLYVTTSGAFADLPFAALLTAPPPGDDLAAAPWLGDRYAFVSLPAVAVLHAGKRADPRRANAGNPFVGYGDPVLAPPGTQRGGPVRASALRAGDTALADPKLLRTMPSLPGTETELKAMAHALTAPAATVRLGAAATEAAVRTDPRLSEARVVAFATHGLLPGDIDGLAEPGLVFTPPPRATPADDGLLLASEAATLRLAADWVVLSACNTASPEGASGSDSLSALARAFLYAGAGSLLASHWRIGDEVTAALTVETLATALAHPQAGHAAALQTAMRAVRRGKRADGSAILGWTRDWAHPAAWAPFALIADGD